MEWWCEVIESRGDAGALDTLGSWTQLKELDIHVGIPVHEPGELERQLTRLAALRSLRISMDGEFELPPGRWQHELLALRCRLEHLLGAGASSAAAALTHATALRQLAAEQTWATPTQPQLRALLSALAALPALEQVRMLLSSSCKVAVEQAHSALGNPLGSRLAFVQRPWELNFVNLESDSD